MFHIFIYQYGANFYLELYIRLINLFFYYFGKIYKHICVFLRFKISCRHIHTHIHKDSVCVCMGVREREKITNRFISLNYKRKRKFGRITFMQNLFLLKVKTFLNLRFFRIYFHYSNIILHGYIFKGLRRKHF